MQEAPRLAPDSNTGPCRQHRASIQRLDRALRLALCIAKRAEVVMAFQALRSLRHHVGIQARAYAPCATTLQRQIGTPVHDHILIHPLDRRKARMEILGNFGGVDHSRWMRPQKRAQAIPQAIRTHRLCKIDVRHLRARMNARIGSPCAQDVGPFAGHRGDGRFERRLHAKPAIANTLPTGKAGAVIFDRQTIPGQSLRRLGIGDGVGTPVGARGPKRANRGG